MTHTFYNRGGMLYIRLNFGIRGQREKKSTGIPIGNLTVINNKVEGLSKAALMANAKIVRIEQSLADGKSLTEAVQTEVYEELDSRTLFADLMDELRLQRPNTKTYNPVTNRYREYVGKHDIVCEDYNLSTIFNNIQRQKAIRELDQHWSGFIDFLADRGLSPSSINTYLNKINAVVSYAKGYKGIELPFNASVKVMEIEPYTWPVNVTEQFLSYSEDSGIMDAAKLMIYTCLRPGDALKVRRKHFKQDGDIYYVENVNQKTQTVTEAPIPEQVWHNLKDCKWIGMSLRAFRYNLPDLLKRAGIDQPAVVYEQRGNKKVRIETTLIEATTPKTLRKVGINRLAEAGVDESIIRDFYSGHGSESVFRKHYRRQELKKVL